MESLVSLFSSLDQETPLSWLVFLLLIFIAVKQTLMSKDVSNIQRNLDNHISDTNKKIDQLSSRFDNLYNILLEKKSPPK